MLLYHVLNRGVEKRDVVMNDDDRMRFVRSLYIFNDAQATPNSITQPQKRDFSKQRERLVLIHAWCLMNNHYHLLLSPIDDDMANVSRFMKKLNMGYAKFFNEKYERSGYLWQGRYKKVLIDEDTQLQYIPYYIHLNPLDYTDYSWREGKVKDLDGVFSTLNAYRWSSYLDYTGTRNFPSVIEQSFLIDILKSKEQQHAQIKQIMSNTETPLTRFSGTLE